MRSQKRKHAKNEISMAEQWVSSSASDQATSVVKTTTVEFSHEEVRQLGLIRRDVTISALIFVLVMSSLVYGWFSYRDDQRVQDLSTRIGKISGFIKD